MEEVLKISVITVCFNSAKTIGDTLRSVASQTHDSVEHIVVDGGSTDESLAIIDQYRAGIAKVVSEADRGIYDAMNKGLKLAGGDIVGFLNADDIYANDRILARVARVMEEEQLDALLGDVEFFKPEDPGYTVRRYRSSRFRPNRLAYGWMPAHPGLFLRKHVYDRHGLFCTDYRIAGDFEYVARVFKDNEIKYCALPEAFVRMRAGGISTGGWKNTVLLNREVLRACRENGIQTNLIKILSKYPAKALEFFFR